MIRMPIDEPLQELGLRENRDAQKFFEEKGLDQTLFPRSVMTLLWHHDAFL